MSRLAWVTLVMIGDNYTDGAIALARSIKQTRVKSPENPDIVCLVTKDVSDVAILKLKAEFDKVISVEYLMYSTSVGVNENLEAVYGSWAHFSYTKWSCLRLVEYDRIIFVDSDIIFVRDASELFQIPGPAAIFDLPQRLSGMLSWYNDLSHRAQIDYYALDNVLAGRNTIFSNKDIVPFYRANIADTSVTILDPKPGIYEKYVALLESMPKPITAPYVINGLEEFMITLFFHKEGFNWSNIASNFALVAWHPEIAIPEMPIYALNYRGANKPWNSDSKWFDTQWWYEVYNGNVSRIVNEITIQNLILLRDKSNFK